MNYFGNDRLRELPLHPTPPPGGLANKARVLTLWRGEEAVTVPFPLLRARADGSGRWRTELLGTSVTFRFLADPDVAMVESSAAPIVAIPSFWFAAHAVNPSISQLDAGF